MPHGEIKVAVRDQGKNEDKDILMAKTNCQTLICHAEMICKSFITRDSDGVIDPTCLFKDYQEAIYQFLVEQVSNTEMKQTNLWTGAEKIIQYTLTVKGKQVGVYDTIRSKRTAGLLLGSMENPFYYEGREDKSGVACDKIWPDIEAGSSFLRANHQNFPWSPSDLRKALIVKTTDFTNQQGGEWCLPLLDPTDPDGKTELKKHGSFLEWEGLEGVSGIIDKIRDKGKLVDLRTLPKEYDLATLVQTKTV